jgi:2-dehydro-3-deoxy-L-rhamnonate dehydrogenase (NAD+)
MRFDGKTALVTGAARGIGLAIAERLLGEGARVALVDRDPEVEAVAKRRGPTARALVADVTVTADVERAVAAAHAWAGRLDVVVNNAGITGRSYPIWELTDDDWQRVIAVDLTSVFLVCRAAVKLMLPRRYGRIVNIASIAGKEGNPNAAHYSSSKAGLIALTKSLGKELAAHDILVNAVTPAAAKTAIFDQLTQQHIDFMLSKIPKGRFVLVEELASMVAWLASEDCAFSTGAVFDISGGRATY